MKFAFVLIALVSLSGCGLIYETADDVAEKVGDGVKYYCENTDAYVREQFNALVNEHATPHKLAITCVEIAPPVETPTE